MAFLLLSLSTFLKKYRGGVGNYQQVMNEQDHRDPIFMKLKKPLHMQRLIYIFPTLTLSMLNISLFF